MPNEEQKDLDGLSDSEAQDLELNHDQMSGPLVHPGLSKSQKIAAAVLAVFSLLVFGAWFSQFGKNINYDALESAPKADACPNGICPSALQNEALKEKDTDGDGLSDWDEMNVYLTSPYLEDSDSDGISDYEETVKKTDPNCPEGRNCGLDNFLLDSQAVIDDSLMETMLQDGSDFSQQELSDFQKAELSEMGGEDIEKYQKLMTGELTAAELRQILTEGGMDPKLLEQISDEQLMKSYRENVNKSGS